MQTTAEDVLPEIVRRLVAEFDPEQIILFGSYAWGRPTIDSDLDLWVILPRSDEKVLDRAVRAHRCLRGLRFPVDVIVKTRAETDRYRNVAASLEAQVLERGKVLYGRSQTGTRPRMVRDGVS